MIKLSRYVALPPHAATLIVAGAVASAMLMPTAPVTAQADQPANSIQPAQPPVGPPVDEVPLEEKDLDTPEKIAAEIERLEEVIEEERRNAWRNEVGVRMVGENTATFQRMQLIWDLYKMQPDHPRMPEWLNDRWTLLGGTAKGSGFARGQSLKVWRNTPEGSPLHHVALYWFARTEVTQTARMPGMSEKRLYQATRKFFDVYPGDTQYGPDLLWHLYWNVRWNPELGNIVLDRIVAEYPDTLAGQRAAGALRHANAVGELFEFEVEDVLTGVTLNHEQYKGQPLVVFFGSPTDVKSLSKLANDHRALREYTEHGVRGLWYCLYPGRDPQARETLLKFLAENDMQWDVAFGGSLIEDELAIHWGITEVPARFVIDKEGRVFASESGLFLERVLDDLLGLNEGGEGSASDGASESGQ